MIVLRAGGVKNFKMNICFFWLKWNQQKACREALIEMSIKLMNCYDNKSDFNLRLMCIDYIGFYTLYV